MNYLRHCSLIAVFAFLALTAHAGVTFHLEVDTHIESREKTKVARDDTHAVFDVTLSDRLIIVKSNDSTVVADFDKRTRTVIDNFAKTRVDYSLYDTVGFRVMELRNREMLGKVLAGAKVDSDLLGSVDNEHILAIQDSASTPLVTKIDGPNEVFSNKSKVFFTRSLQATPVSPEDARMFAQFLRYQYAGHPQILTVLAKSQSLPSKFVLYTYDVVLATRSMTVSAVLPSEDKSFDIAAFPARVPSLSANPLNQLLDRAVAFTRTDMMAARKRSVDELPALFRDGKVFDAFLATIEWILMTGEPFPELTPEQKDLFQSDSAVGRLTAALSPSNTKEGLSEAIRAFTELRPSAPTKAYVLAIFEANNQAMLGNRQVARKLFIEALTSNPYIAGAYKDLGDVVIMDFDAPSAWRCWDQGRRLAPMFRNFEAVNQFEHSLLTSHPEYF